MTMVYDRQIFPKLLNLKECQDFARFIGKDIGGDVNVGTVADRGDWPMAEISKSYDEGFVHALMSFYRKENNYSGIFLQSEIHFKGMKDLTGRLYSDIENSYKKFFK